MASSTTEGGYDFDFITDLPEDLTCVLCHFAFKNPVQVEECGHVFCKHCFDHMKDHAENNCVEMLCPLDRQNIDVTRVFKDKRDERRVLNLMVKCHNFGENCDWTGELREALEHETNCCRNDTMFEQLMGRMTVLESKVKCHEQKHAEKDNLIRNQEKQIENLSKQTVEQNKEIENLAKDIRNQETIIESLKQYQNNNPNNPQLTSTPLSMIIPNIEDESNYSPIYTAFQWKFNPNEVKCGGQIYSPPFYNFMNAHCFQLDVVLENNHFNISLYRYRGKYDHNVNAIKVMNNFDFRVHIFAKSGKLKILNWGNEDYSILKQELKSNGWWKKGIKNGEIDNLTVDGYVHLHCFFNNINQC